MRNSNISKSLLMVFLASNSFADQVCIDSYDEQTSSYSTVCSEIPSSTSNDSSGTYGESYANTATPTTAATGGSFVYYQGRFIWVSQVDSYSSNLAYERPESVCENTCLDDRTACHNKEREDGIYLGCSDTYSDCINKCKTK